MYLRQLNGTRPVHLVAPANVGFWGIAFARDGQSIYYGAEIAVCARPATCSRSPRSAARRAAALGISTAASPFRPIDRGSRSTASISPRATACSWSRMPTDRSARALATKQPPEFFAPGLLRRALVVAGRQADRRRRAQQRNARRAPRHDRLSHRQRDSVSGPVLGR